MWKKGRREEWGKAEEESERSSRGNHRAYGVGGSDHHDNLCLWGKGTMSHSLRPVLPSCPHQQLHSYIPPAIYQASPIRRALC